MEPLTSNAGDRDLPSARALEYNDEIINGKLAPPKGLVHESLFSKRLRNDDERFDRLENAVQALHDALNTHLPAIENLSAIEGDIQELVGQLQTLVSEPMVSAAAPLDIQQESLSDVQVEAESSRTSVSENNSSAVFKPIAPKQPTPASELPSTPIKKADYAAATPKAAPITQGGAGTTGNIASSVSGVNAIRVSQSPDKTRVVLDSSYKIDYTLDYDGQENLILLTAKNADVTASLTAAASKSNKIISITLAKEGDHSNLIFLLQGASSISSGVSLPPNSDASQYRYYFDIF